MLIVETFDRVSIRLYVGVMGSVYRRAAGVKLNETRGGGEQLGEDEYGKLVFG
jgi:hypothetical protein